MANILLLDRGFLSESRAYFAAMTTQEPTRVKMAIDKFIAGLKANNLWSVIDGGQILALGTNQAGRVDFKEPSRVASVAGSPTHTFTAYQGFTGSGALAGAQTDYIDTGFTPSTAGGAMVQDSAHLAIYSRSTGQVAAFDFGAQGTHDLQILLRNASDASQARSNNATSNNISANGVTTNGSGFFVLSRTGAAVTNGYRNGASIGGTLTTASTGIPDVPIRYIQAQSGAGTTRQYAFGCWGSGLAASQVAVLNWLVQTLMTDLGAAV